MNQWPQDLMPVQAGYPPPDVQRHCVQNAYWQQVRRSMKRKTTEDKLKTLEVFWKLRYLDYPYATEVQVGNYLGALRRGGQLDMQNKVQR